MYASIRRTPRPSSSATSSFAASVAYPRPCQGSPITQATTARAPSCTVAWTYPTAVPSTRTIQLSHSSRPSTERPTTWRRYCSVSSPRSAAGRR